MTPQDELFFAILGRRVADLREEAAGLIAEGQTDSGFEKALTADFVQATVLRARAASLAPSTLVEIPINAG